MMRGLILGLSILVLLAACASGSGRQGTQIAVTGVGPAAAVQSGAATAFVMTVANTGEYPASNVKLVDNVGNQLKLMSITCAASGGAACPSAPSVEMVLTSLPSGGTLIFTVNVQLAANASGIIQNTMAASFAQQIDPAEGSFSATGSAVTTTTNIVVGGTGPTATLVGGAQAVFVMTVTNNGPDPAGAFNVYDNVGAGLKLLSITCAAASGATCPASVGVLTAVTGLPSGGVLTFTATTQIGQNANGVVTNGLVVNVATNPNQSANSFYVNVNVVTAAISVTGTAPPGPLVAGVTGDFTMVVTNNGPGTAQNLTITNALSAAATANGAIVCTASGDPGAMCPATLGATMTVASLPADGVLTFTIPITVVTGANGAVTDTMTVTSPTDPKGTETVTAGVGSTTSSLVIVETGEPKVAAGSTAVFTAILTNNGPAASSNITVTYALSGPAGTVATVTCASPASISCPATLGPTMTVPSLGIGRSLQFTFSVPVPLAASGQAAIVNIVTATSADNTNATTNTASYSSLPVNESNGTYEVFGANGNQYLMDIDFDNPVYEITGNGQDITENFTQDSTGGGYTVTGISRFRLASDLIVGAQDFGNGVTPYVAARVFGTTVQQLSTAYNIVTLEIPATGSPSTYAGTARISGNTLEICITAQQVVAVQSCPASSLQSYTLSIGGNIYTATNTASGTTFSFQLALIDALPAILANGPLPDGSAGLMIGLPKAAALAGGVSQGPSTAPDWITMTLTPNSYAYTGQNGASDSAPLAAISTFTGPFSLLEGPRASDGADIYVMQALPLSIAFGATSGAANGLLQVTIP